jgi:hypothetical protein
MLSMTHLGYGFDQSIFNTRLDGRASGKRLSKPMLGVTHFHVPDDDLNDTDGCKVLHSIGINRESTYITLLLFRS